jgi:hypothetical protein
MRMGIAAAPPRPTSKTTLQRLLAAKLDRQIAQV